MCDPLWTAEILIAIRSHMFRRSSAVEQLTVNQLVVGSIPTAGANFLLCSEFGTLLGARVSAL